MRNLPKAFQKFRKVGNLEVGSIVLIQEDNMPRMKWRLGVVEKRHVGKDGVTRAVDLRTSSGRKTRPVQRLYNLEVRRVEEVQEEVEVDEDSSHEQDVGGDDVGDDVGGDDAGDDDGGDDSVSADEVETRSSRPRRNKTLPSKYRDFDMR